LSTFYFLWLVLIIGRSQLLKELEKEQRRSSELEQERNALELWKEMATVHLWVNIGCHPRYGVFILHFLEFAQAREEDLLQDVMRLRTELLRRDEAVHADPGILLFGDSSEDAAGLDS
jgi:hypothetical protein